PPQRARVKVQGAGEAVRLLLRRQSCIRLERRDRSGLDAGDRREGCGVKAKTRPGFAHDVAEFVFKKLVHSDSPCQASNSSPTLPDLLRQPSPVTLSFLAARREGRLDPVWKREPFPGKG